MPSQQTHQGALTQRLLSPLMIGALSISGCSHTSVENVKCESSGMAGVTFGRTIEQGAAPIIEVTDSGVTYYSLEPSIDIQPFEKLIVGVTPKSKQVFSIRMEMHGKEVELDRVIDAQKNVLSQLHTSLSWRVIGNHHYGEGLENLDVALYRIGDIVDDEPSYLMSYDCDSKTYRKIVFDEARVAKLGF